jgi:hypothetical protein
VVHVNWCFLAAFSSAAVVDASTPMLVYICGNVVNWNGKGWL